MSIKKYTVGELIEKLSTYDKNDDVCLVNSTNCIKTGENSFSIIQHEQKMFIVGKKDADDCPIEELKEKIRKTVVIAQFFEDDKDVALVPKNLLKNKNILMIESV